MKTATITFHAPNNNGSFLQAYALQKYITTHFDNVENEIIDFQPESQQQQYAIFRKIHSKKDILRNLISFWHYKALSKRFFRGIFSSGYFQEVYICCKLWFTFK